MFNAYLVYLISLGLGHNDYKVREQTTNHAIVLNNIFDLRKDLNNLANKTDDAEIRVRAANIAKTYNIIFPFPFTIPPIHCLNGINEPLWCAIWWHHFQPYYIPINRQGFPLTIKRKVWMTTATLEDLRVQTFMYIRTKNYTRWNAFWLLMRMKYNEVAGRFFTPYANTDITEFRLSE